MYVHNTKAWRSVKILYTLPLAKPAQAKIQTLTTSSRIVSILLKSFLKSLGLYQILMTLKFSQNYVLKFIREGHENLPTYEVMANEIGIFFFQIFHSV